MSCVCLLWLVATWAVAAGIGFAAALSAGLTALGVTGTGNGFNFPATLVGNFCSAKFLGFLAGLAATVLVLSAIDGLVLAFMHGSW